MRTAAASDAQRRQRRRIVAALAVARGRPRGVGAPVLDARLGRDDRPSPGATTVPVHRTGPVSAVIARVKFAFSSSVVQRVPASASDTKAVPIAESRSVVANPACTVPIGL